MPEADVVEGHDGADFLLKVLGSGEHGVLRTRLVLEAVDPHDVPLDAEVHTVGSPIA